MLDKKKLKTIANKLGIKVTFDSDNPGFFSENDNKNYNFSDLDRVIDKTL
ncbi:MAG: hypothetical protein M3Z87_05300 [Lactobacillus sp.]|nr:hypothetical protein [Lactobacillus sp.]